MKEEESYFNLIKGFVLEMIYNIKGMLLGYFDEVYSDISENICKRKICIFINKIYSVICFISIIVLLGMTFFISLGMIYKFAMIALCFLLCIGVIFLWNLTLNRLNKNSRQWSIGTFPFAMVVIYFIVKLFSVYIV